MHQLIADLTKMLNLTPEQQFRVSAMIKREIHAEKAELFDRYAQYGQGYPIVDRTDPENPKIVGREEPKDKWLHNIMVDKAKQHAEWAIMPDEKVITWSVGSFKYKQDMPPCSVCQVKLPTSKGYCSTHGKEGAKYFCPEHAPKAKE